MMIMIHSELENSTYFIKKDIIEAIQIIYKEEESGRILFKVSGEESPMCIRFGTSKVDKYYLKGMESKLIAIFSCDS